MIRPRRTYHSAQRAVVLNASTRRASTVLTVSLCAFAHPAEATAAQPAIVRAHPRGDATITLDGALTEPVWSEAAEAGEFIERTPTPRAEPAAATTFLVLYDKNTLYIGIRMALLPGEEPRALELSRDSFSLFSDDAISIKLDVRLDARTTIGFVTNPAGAQMDYVSVENGVFRREFDAIWEVATSVSDTEWVAEMKIPAIALGLPAVDGPREIGLQLSRDHNARLATYDWTEMPPEFGPTSALHYGRITGLDDMASGAPLSLLPFVLGDYDSRGERFGASAGGEVRLRLGDDIWTELTVLTDFAQVDLDDPVVNLNRFELFFPEKRPFFLSGLDVFEVGVPGFVQIFFSRRIGLDDDGNEVPLVGGVKAYGSSGGLRFGLLGVLTADTSSVTAESWTVARVRQNFGERAHLGLMATLNGNLPFPGDDHGAVPFAPDWTFGADGSLRAFDRRLELKGFWAGTANEDRGEDAGALGQSGRIEGFWRGKNLQPGYSFTFVSPEFDPTVGFVGRQDLLQSRLSLAWVARPDVLDLAQIYSYVAVQTEHDFAAELHLGQLADVSTTFTFRSGFGFTLGATVYEDFVTESFELVPGHDVQADRYPSVAVNARFQTPQGRNPYGWIEGGVTEGFFGGALRRAAAGGAASFGPHVGVNASANLSVLEFEGKAPTRALTLVGSVLLTPSTTLSIDLVLQANTLDERATALARVRWRYLPGSDLFLVYREELSYADELTGERTVTLKASYRFDTLL